MEKDIIKNSDNEAETNNKIIDIEVKNFREFNKKEDYERLYNFDFWLSTDGNIYIFEAGQDHNQAASQIKSGNSREDLEAAGRVRGSWVARKAEGLLFVHPGYQRLTMIQKDFLYYFILYNKDKPEISKDKYKNILKVLDYGQDIIDQAREQMWSSFLS